MSAATPAVTALGADAAQAAVTAAAKALGLPTVRECRRPRKNAQ